MQKLRHGAARGGAARGGARSERSSSRIATSSSSSATTTTSSSSSSSTASSRAVPAQQQEQRRRGLLLGLAASAAAVSSPVPPAAAELDPAGAFVAWWRSRRTANGGAKLLAPLYVAQRRLQEAADLLEQLRSGGTPGVDDLTAVLQLVRASSLNCYIFAPLPDDTIETRASLITQQLELSDPCTFRIVLKNATDLEPAEVQAAARDKMDALVLSYNLLDDLLDMAREGNADAVPKAAEQLATTRLLAADIEAFVKATLGV